MWSWTAWTWCSRGWSWACSWWVPACPSPPPRVCSRTQRTHSPASQRGHPLYPKSSVNYALLASVCLLTNCLNQFRALHLKNTESLSIFIKETLGKQLKNSQSWKLWPVSPCICVGKHKSLYHQSVSVSTNLTKVRLESLCRNSFENLSLRQIDRSCPLQSWQIIFESGFPSPNFKSQSISQQRDHYKRTGPDQKRLGL